MQIRHILKKKNERENFEIGNEKHTLDDDEKKKIKNRVELQVGREKKNCGYRKSVSNPRYREEKYKENMQIRYRRNALQHHTTQ